MIYIMLFSFITIIISSICYLVYVDWNSKRFNRSVNKIYNRFGNMISEDFINLTKGNPPNVERMSYIKRKMKRSAYEKVFQNIIVKHANDQIYSGFVSDYMQKYEKYLMRKLKKVKINGSVKHIQNVFMLGEYRLNHPNIINYLLEGVSSSSIISRFNSMSAISKIGNAEALVKSLMISTEYRRYMNMKVFTDILDNFEGDKQLLNERLIFSFNHFNHELKLLVINFFYNEGSLLPQTILHDYLKVVKDKEEHIQLLKYFGAIQYTEALHEIKEGLKSTYWEVRAVAARALLNYTEHLVLKDIIQSMSDENWYVRTNTASVVLEHLRTHLNKSEQEIDHLIEDTNDKYAVGAIEYARHLKIASK